MSIFHFKQFDISNVRSAMKVNTDGVLLGATVDLSPWQDAGLLRPLDDAPIQVLDVGTGTGTIALMVAQRLSQNCCIVGIDVDEASAEEAAENFSKCPWSASLKAVHQSLETYSPDQALDLIISNPPYFDTSLKAPEQRRNHARHTESLSFRELMDFAKVHLKDGGRLAVILPSDVERSLLRYGRMCSLFPVRLLRIRTTPKKQPARLMVEFAKGLRPEKGTSVLEEQLTLQDNGRYTEEYTRLVHDFYLWA